MLQCFISLKNISQEELKQFQFYESFTVHESSLSSCGIPLGIIDKMDMAYTFTYEHPFSLDDYNKEVEEVI
jgi:maltose phosphorylase